MPSLHPVTPTAWTTLTDATMPAPTRLPAEVRSRLGRNRGARIACWGLLVAATAAFAQPAPPLRPAPMATATPNDAARGFYAVYLAWRNWGAVADAGRRPFTPVVSAGLSADLAATAGAGGPRDVFTSLVTGADRADVGRCTTRGEAARCEVTLVVRDPVTGIDHRWRDTAIVRRENGSWVVDDVEYGGRWPGANSGTLRGNLQALSVPPIPPPSMPPPAAAAPRR